VLGSCWPPRGRGGGAHGDVRLLERSSTHVLAAGRHRAGGFTNPRSCGRCSGGSRSLRSTTRLISALVVSIRALLLHDHLLRDCRGSGPRPRRCCRRREGDAARTTVLNPVSSTRSSSPGSRLGSDSARRRRMARLVAPVPVFRAERRRRAPLPTRR
jgi:hypothetical protein